LFRDRSEEELVEQKEYRKDERLVKRKQDNKTGK
jgi:hypothetical protein